MGIILPRHSYILMIFIIFTVQHILHIYIFFCITVIRTERENVLNYVTAKKKIHCSLFFLDFQVKCTTIQKFGVSMIFFKEIILFSKDALN